LLLPLYNTYTNEIEKKNYFISIRGKTPPKVVFAACRTNQATQLTMRTVTNVQIDIHVRKLSANIKLVCTNFKNRKNNEFLASFTVSVSR
jgi:hypothetical protein